MKYMEQVQKIANEYMESGQPWPASKVDIARWAISTGRWKAQPEHLVAQCAEEIGQAMTGEHYTDPQGRSVRAKHAARVRREGKTTWLWDDHRTMNRRHAAVSFSLRRTQMVGECKQLKNDVDSFNENRSAANPIQVSFNFTRDLEDAAFAHVASTSSRGRRSTQLRSVLSPKPSGSPPSRP